MAREGERPSFRSVANAIRTGIFIDKIYRGMSHGTQMEIPADIKEKLKVGAWRELVIRPISSYLSIELFQTTFTSLSRTKFISGRGVSNVSHRCNNSSNLFTRHLWSKGTLHCDYSGHGKAFVAHLLQGGQKFRVF